jgi:hypothetical protein
VTRETTGGGHRNQPDQNPYGARPAPLSVFPAAQHHPRLQRTGRYTPASFAHPAKMLPELARHLITGYSRPGETVCDPMCGIGTTLVEAAHLGRHAIGVDLESRWVSLARTNLTLAAESGAPGTGQVLHGNARHLTDLIPAGAHGTVSLLLTSPPYGPATHGQVTARPGQGVHKTDYTYSAGRDNLAYAGLPGLLDGMADILTATRKIMRPGGIVALTVRPYRVAGELVDLPGALVDIAVEEAGLVRHGRAVALLAALRGGGLVPRATFFALHNTRTARAAGHPLHLLAHEDVLLFTVP